MSKKVKNEAEILLIDQLKEINGLQVFQELQFYKPRKWRFDAAIPGIGIEIEGGAWTQGRHTRGKGFIDDMEKYNHAAMLGWRVLRFTPQQVLRGEAIAFILRVLDN